MSELMNHLIEAAEDGRYSDTYVGSIVRTQVLTELKALATLVDAAKNTVECGRYVIDNPEGHVTSDYDIHELKDALDRIEDL